MLEIHLQQQVAQFLSNGLRRRARQGRGDEPLRLAILAALPREAIAKSAPLPAPLKARICGALEFAAGVVELVKPIISRGVIVSRNVIPFSREFMLLVEMMVKRSGFCAYDDGRLAQLPMPTVPICVRNSE